MTKARVKLLLIFPILWLFVLLETLSDLKWSIKRNSADTYTTWLDAWRNN